MRISLGLHLASWVAYVSSLPTIQNSPVVHLKNGTYEGKHIASYNQDAFLSVPFAQPPVGDLRLRASQPLNTTWAGTRNATEYGPACIGYGEDTAIGGSGYVREDCLTLNVVRPSPATGYETRGGEGLPILVWIYGGGFVEGAARDPRYNLSFIVDQSVQMGKPIIGVSINYRLHGWGWLWSREVVEAGVANLGLRDQRLALQWIRENIAAFGGDPDKVTIYGESAGGISVGLHLLAYNGRDDGLFRSAVASSGPPTGVGLLNPTIDTAEELWANITRDTGCAEAADRLDCLRGLSTEQLNATLAPIPGEDYYKLYFGPLTDGDIVARGATEQLLDGSYVKVPYILGECSDDGTDFTPLGLNTEADFSQYISAFGFDNATLEDLFRLYSDTPQASAEYIPVSAPYNFNETIGLQFKRTATLLGDLFFKAPRRLASQVWTAQNSADNRTQAPLYSFRFNAIPNGVPDYLAATHWTDVPFVFHDIAGDGFPGTGSPPYFSDPPFEDRPQSFADLSTLMSRMWVSFVADGDPNFEDAAVAWPPYTVDKPAALVFDANVTSYVEVDTYRDGQLGYLVDRYTEGGGVWGVHDTS
ncbi:carboxylesterase family protein [Whalleya microplaca]|nr:carboxylesterase family protein [Whalleya microplaca]